MSERFDKHLEKFREFISGICKSCASDRLDFGDSMYEKMKKESNRFIKWSNRADLEDQAMCFLNLLVSGCIIKKKVAILKVIDEQWLSSQSNILNYSDGKKLPLYIIYDYCEEEGEEFIDVYQYHLSRILYLSLDWLKDEDIEDDILTDEKHVKRIMRKLKDSLDIVSKKLNKPAFIDESFVSGENQGDFSPAALIGSLLNGAEGGNFMEKIMELVSGATQTLAPMLNNQLGEEMDPKKASLVVNNLLTTEDGKDGMKEIIEKLGKCESMAEMAGSFKDIIGDKNNKINKLLEDISQENGGDNGGSSIDENHETSGSS